MNVLNWNHPPIDDNQTSSLTEAAASGASQLTVVNTKGFAVNKLLLIGTFGSEDAEIVKVHASTPLTDTVITLAAALKYSHSTDTPVVLLDWDQIEISRAASEGGSYSVLATVDIAADEESTPYRDASGATTSYYKIRFKNSIDGSFSGYSAEVPASGFDDETLAGMVETVFAEFGTQSQKVLDRTSIVRWLNEGYQKEVAQIQDLDIDFYVKYGTDGAGAPIPFVASQRAYSLPDGFVRVKVWDFCYDNVNYVRAFAMRPEDDYSTASYSQSHPRYFYEGNNIVPLPIPSASTGGMRPRYVYMPAKMSDDSDTPDLPTGYRTTPVNYALQKAFQSDRKFDVSKYYGELWSGEVATMLEAIKNRYPERREVIPEWGEGEDTLFDGFRLPSL